MARTDGKTFRHAPHHLHLPDVQKNYLNTPEFDRYPFWIAHYKVKKLRYKGAWDFWQHTEEGCIDGITGKVDFNVYNGSLDDLQKVSHWQRLKSQSTATTNPDRSIYTEKTFLLPPKGNGRIPSRLTPSTQNRARGNKAPYPTNEQKKPSAPNRRNEPKRRNGINDSRLISY